jgi:hypothetical protein
MTSSEQDYDIYEGFAELDELLDDMPLERPSERLLSLDSLISPTSNTARYLERTNESKSSSSGVTFYSARSQGGMGRSAVNDYQLRE